MLVERHIPCRWRDTGIPAQTCRATQADPAVAKECEKFNCPWLGRLPAKARPVAPPRPAAPEAPRVCACGCGEPVRKLREYASKACWQRAWWAANKHRLRPKDPAKGASDSPEPRLCACNCGKPARERSKYATPGCRRRGWQTANPDKVREYGRRSAKKRYHAEKAAAAAKRRTRGNG